MKTILSFLVIFVVFFAFTGVYGQTLTFVGETYNTTAFHDNTVGVEQKNYNMQLFSLEGNWKLTPKLYFGVRPLVMLDNVSTSFGAAGTISSDNFSIQLGGGTTNYKSGSEFRNPPDAKNQEMFWYLRGWVGYQYTEVFAETFGNTNDLKFFRGAAIVRPLGDPVWGLGLLVEKNYPRHMKLSGYTDFNLHRVKSLPGLTVSAYAALGGFNGNNGTELTATFGLRLKWSFNISISSGK